MSRDRVRPVVRAVMQAQGRLLLMWSRLSNSERYTWSQVLRAEKVEAKRWSS